MHTMIIAEAGVNHNGSLEIAKQLCLAAKQAGADIVKFQTWKTEKIITKNVEQAEYQKENTGEEESQYDMLKSLELSYDDFKEIKHYCDEIGIIFASTADEEESLDFLVELGIPFIKVGSGDINNISYLRYIGAKKRPVILSTGMSYLSDVDIAVRELQQAGCNDITLLHCTTNYPCDKHNVNLNSLKTLSSAFGLPVGYSDHTQGNEVSIAAVALGACVIEKHFTLDRQMSGPDHMASVEPKEFADMVKAIRNVEMAMGDGIKKPTKGEKEISKVVLKKILASKEINEGDIIKPEDLCVKRNDIGIPAQYWDLIVGSRAKKKYAVDEPIEI